MPKSIPVEPQAFQRAGELAFPRIPLHAYARPFEAELAARGQKQMVDILRHMMLVREFETMLGSFKAKGVYADISYVYKGPAHLSLGQEGAAVGAALALVGIGFCGALTTFSTLALEVWDAVQDERPAAAATVVTLSLLLGLGAASAGFLLTS